MNGYQQLRSSFFQAPPTMGTVMQYAQLKGVLSYSNKNFIFVEGSTDISFYRYTNIKVLANDAEYITSPTKTNTPNGKQGVLLAYNQIKNSSQLNSDIGRCIFIVDRDWSNTNEWSAEEQNKITVTSGHSMENYFLEKSNIKAIFKELNIEQDVSDFTSKFNKFCNETKEYYACKAAITYAYQKGVGVQYKAVEWGKVFNFSYNDGEICYDKALLLQETKSMLSEIARISDEDVTNYKNEISDRIKKNNRHIRGHEAYNFLSEYLRGKHNIIINFTGKDETFRNIVNKLSVNITVKR